MMMKYKIVFMDMDGTLLDSRGYFSEYTKSVFKRVMEKGIKLVLCTGRMYQNARYYARKLDLNAPIICSNGALIRGIEDENPIFIKPLGEENLLALQKELKNLNLRCNYYSSETLYVGIRRKYVDNYLDLNKKIDDGKLIEILRFDESNENDEKNEVNKENEENKLVLKRSETITKAMFFPKIDEVETIKKTLRERIDLNFVSSADDNIEAVHKSTGKGSAIKYLCDYYGIDLTDSIAIGDSENDLTMFESSGLSVSMGNAPNNIKEVTDITIKRNNEDGVARFLEKMFL